MTAKFLWNPNYDANRAMSEFLEGYYGKAAAPIRAYIDLLHDRVEQKNIHVTICVAAEQPASDRRAAGQGRRTCGSRPRSSWPASRELLDA